MVQELGASSAQYLPENVTAFEQVSVYSALAAGANGFLLWCYTDAAPEQYRKVPYLRSPHETQFGLTTWDRQMRPQGLAFQSFSRIVARMNLAQLAVPPGDAAIVIPEEWSRTRGDFSRFGLTGPEVTPYVSVADGGAVAGTQPAPYDVNQWVMSATLSAFILAHRAGLKPSLPREADDWAGYPLLLLPSPLTATDPVFAHLHTDFWERARAYVQRGGALYASLASNSAIPEMAALFGARMTDTVIDGEVTLKIVRAAREPEAWRHLSFRAAGRHRKVLGHRARGQRTVKSSPSTRRTGPPSLRIGSARATRCCRLTRSRRGSAASRPHSTTTTRPTGSTARCANGPAFARSSTPTSPRSRLPPWSRPVEGTSCS